jgi:hypothetical protein
MRDFIIKSLKETSHSSSFCCQTTKDCIYWISFFFLLLLHWIIVKYGVFCVLFYFFFAFYCYFCVYEASAGTQHYWTVNTPEIAVMYFVRINFDCCAIWGLDPKSVFSSGYWGFCWIYPSRWSPFITFRHVQFPISPAQFFCSLFLIYCHLVSW